MKVLFASRHVPSPEQMADLERIFPGYSLEKRDILWESLDQINEVLQECDVLIPVLPGHLMAQIAFYSGIAIGENSYRPDSLNKIFISVSAPVKAADGTIRPFVHQYFVKMNGKRV